MRKQFDFDQSGRYQFCSLIDESLQVVGILLHHGQHVVEDVGPHALPERPKLVPNCAEVRALTYRKLKMSVCLKITIECLMKICQLGWSSGQRRCILMRRLSSNPADIQVIFDLMNYEKTT